MRGALVALVLLLGAAAAAQPRQAPPKEEPPPAPLSPAPPDYFGLGNAHYERGEYDEAIARFTEGYQAQQDPVYLFNIAQAHRLAGRPREALDYYRRYLRAVPTASNRAEVETRVAALERAPEGDGARRAADPGEEAFALAKEGRRLVKEGRTQEGLQRLREALQRADVARLPDGDRAELEYSYGLALLRADRDGDAATALRRATTLSPDDAEMHLDLAVALDRSGDADGALAAAERALRLGLSGDDRGAAEHIAREARRQRVRDRLTVDASVTMAFDSNVLQGTRETIAGRFTGSTTQRAPDLRTRTGIRTVVMDIAQQYRTPAPPRREMDMPISLFLDLGGRAFRTRWAQLWAEYHFSQVFMTLPESAVGSDHDIYNYQEHRATLRLRTQPASRLQLMLKADGFANFTGLKEFAPFQGGIHGGVEAVLRETQQLQTRLAFTHQYRASFDRSAQSYTNECGQRFTETDTIFDGNRDDLSLIQELRLRWLRSRLGYQFHSDQTGVLLIDQPYYFAGLGGQETVLGCYNYRAPLSYLGHEALLSARFLLPRGFELYGGLRYEYRAYEGLYGAVFHPNRVGTMDQNLGALPRRDHRVSFDLSATATLPRGFGLELSYSLVQNISNIANGIDNRNYDKHVVALWGTYSF